MPTLPLPQINHERCTGCHACVDRCPTGALALVGGKAVLHVPTRCTYCAACEEICPTNAIALPFVVVIKNAFVNIR